MARFKREGEAPVAEKAPPAQRRTRKKAECRRRILEAAKHVFFRDGYMDANLDEVAEKAGLAKGTLYLYFDSKASLYVAILSQNGDIFEQKLRSALIPGQSPPEQVRLAVRFYFRHYIENAHYFQIFWALENQSVIGELPAPLVKDVTKLWERSLRILARIIEQGVREGFFTDCDPWEVANIIWTLANGLIQTEHSFPHRRLRRRKLARVFDDAIDLVLRGLAVPNRGIRS